MLQMKTPHIYLLKTLRIVEVLEPEGGIIYMFRDA